MKSRKNDLRNQWRKEIDQYERRWGPPWGYTMLTIHLLKSQELIKSDHSLMLMAKRCLVDFFGGEPSDIEVFS